MLTRARKRKIWPAVVPVICAVRTFLVPFPYLPGTASVREWYCNPYLFGTSRTKKGEDNACGEMIPDTAVYTYAGILVFRGAAERI